MFIEGLPKPAHEKCYYDKIKITSTLDIRKPTPKMRYFILLSIKMYASSIIIGNDVFVSNNDKFGTDPCKEILQLLWGYL